MFEVNKIVMFFGVGYAIVVLVIAGILIFSTFSGIDDSFSTWKNKEEKQRRERRK
jgi:hypothetical protein